MPSCRAGPRVELSANGAIVGNGCLRTRRVRAELRRAARTNGPGTSQPAQWPTCSRSDAATCQPSGPRFARGRTIVVPAPFGSRSQGVAGIGRGARLVERRPARRGLAQLVVILLVVAIAFVLVNWFWAFDHQVHTRSTKAGGEGEGGSGALPKSRANRGAPAPRRAGVMLDLVVDLRRRYSRGPRSVINGMPPSRSTTTFVVDKLRR